MTTANGLVLFAFAAFSITLIQQCQSKDLGPTLSFTINYRLGKPITLNTALLNKDGVLGRLQSYGVEYLKKYDAIVVMHFLGKDANVVPTVVAKNETELTNINKSLVDAISISFGGMDKELNEKRIENLTAQDVRKWDKSNVLDPAALAPVLFVYVDIGYDNEHWDPWQTRAAAVTAKGFDVIIMYNNYVSPSISVIGSKIIGGYLTRNYGTGKEPAIKVWETMHKEVVERARTSCPKKGTAGDCHFASSGTCAVGERKLGDFCFFTECLKKTCEDLCNAKPKESKCSVTCGSGKKTKGTEKGSDPKLKNCPEKEVDCTEAPCPAGPKATTKKGPTPTAGSKAGNTTTGIGAPQKLPIWPDPNKTTTSGIGAPQKIPIWPVLLLWFVVVQAGRMWQWMEG